MGMQFVNQTIINKKDHNKKCKHMLMLPYSSVFVPYQSKATNCAHTIYDNTALHCYRPIAQCSFGKEFQTALIQHILDLPRKYSG